MAEGEAETDEGTTEAGDRPLAGAALKSALEKERKDRKDLEKSVKALQVQVDAAAAEKAAAKKAAEDASKSEIERLSDQIASLTAERTAERETVERERGERARADHVRKAAAKFVDPDDVVALLRGMGDLAGIDDETDAARIVDALATAKPHLLKQETNLSGFEQVLENGRAKLPADKGDGTFTPADARTVVPFETLNKMDDAQLAALRQRDPGLYERSMDGLSGYGPDGMKVVSQ